MPRRETITVARVRHGSNFALVLNASSLSRDAHEVMLNTAARIEREPVISSSLAPLCFSRGVRRTVAVLLSTAAYLLSTRTVSAPDAWVLYVVALTIVAGEARAREIAVSGCVVAMLVAVGFGVTQTQSPLDLRVLRLAGPLTVIGLTTWMLLRGAADRRAVVEANRARGHSEWRYRSIFRQSRFPLWELDFSHAMQVLGVLKSEGVTDIVSYSRRTPGFLDSLKPNIRFSEMNDAMFVHFGMRPGVDRMPAHLGSIVADDGQLLEVLQAILDAKDHYDGRGHTTMVDGRSKEVIFGVSISYEGERAGSVIGTLVDVSERVKAQEVLAVAQAELARSSRVAAVGAVSASIAHELNQPLGAVVMNAQTCLRYLRRVPPDVACAIAAAEAVVQEGYRAGEIVRETRELITKRRTRDERINLDALLEETVELLHREIDTIGAVVTLDLQAEPVWLFGDRTALQQAFINLLSNALTAVATQPPEARRLSVALAHDSDHLLVTASDSGPGISAEHLPQIFEPFFTTKEGGIGMGLAISRSAIEAHGGTLTARNQGTGGAVFEAQLPLRREEMRDSCAGDSR